MNRRLMTTLLSIAIAFGLWVYVVNVVSPESEETFRNVPVVFEGEGLLEERGLMVTSGEDVTVTLKLVGRRTNLAKVNSKNLSVRVDLSRIYGAGVHEMSYSISYPSDVPNDAFTVLSREPATIRLVVEERVRKNIPVEVVYLGSLAEGMIYDKQNAAISPQTVTVAGPSRVVDRIEKAQVRVDLTGRTGSVIDNFDYSLCDKGGVPVETEEVSTDVSQIRLELKIQRVKEIPLVLNINPVGGYLADNTVVTQSLTSIRVSGSEADLENLNQIVLPLIDLTKYLENTTLEFPIVLPEGVTNLTGVDHVQVSIQLPEMAAKPFVLSQFKIVDVPDGMEVEVLTQQLAVTMRGPQSQIDALSAEDLEVIVSFAGAEVGTEWVSVKIQVVSGYDVSAVGSYSVSATIRVISQGESG